MSCVQCAAATGAVWRRLTPAATPRSAFHQNIQLIRPPPFPFLSSGHNPICRGYVTNSERLANRCAWRDLGHQACLVGDAGEQRLPHTPVLHRHVQASQSTNLATYQGCANLQHDFLDARPMHRPNLAHNRRLFHQGSCIGHHLPDGFLSAADKGHQGAPACCIMPAAQVHM